MPYPRFFSWPRALFFLLTSTQARVALFDLLEYRAEDAAERYENVLDRRQQPSQQPAICTEDIYLSILSAAPSSTQFCYGFVKDYDTQTSAYTTTPITYVCTSTLSRLILTNDRTAIRPATTKYYTATNTITSTVSVTTSTTSTSYVQLRKRVPEPTGGPQLDRRDTLTDEVTNIIKRALGDNSTSTSNSTASMNASEAASITSALSSACTCLDLPNPTVNTTITAPTSVC